MSSVLTSEQHHFYSVAETENPPHGQAVCAGTDETCSFAGSDSVCSFADWLVTSTPDAYGGPCIDVALDEPIKYLGSFSLGLEQIYGLAETV